MALPRLCRMVALQSAVAIAILASPASADAPLLPVTVGAGVQASVQPDFVTGVDTFSDYDASYDLGPRAAVPFRAAIEANYQRSPRAGGRSAVGADVSVQTTAPFYGGAGLEIYDVTNPPTPYGQRIHFTSDAPPGGETTTKTTYASEFFLGQQLFSLPGASVSIQATFRLFPLMTSGSYPDTAGLGIRVKI